MPHGGESAVTIPGEVPLHGILHSCCEASGPRWGLVFCDPFAEEKKCAHRVLVEAARAFCAADVSCLRFDYRGTGDSPGDFVAFTPRHWAEDIAAAVRFARETLEVEMLGLLGLRLGAAHALQAAQTTGGADFLVLWEPVLDGKSFIAHNLRRSMIKGMLTQGEDFDAQGVRQAHGGAAFDFDGYRVSGETRDQIEAVNLLGTTDAFTGPSLVVNIASREHPGEGYQRLGDMLGGAVVAVRQEPFWNRIGLADPGPVVQVTELWLAEQQAAWLAKRPEGAG
jgi:alpha/beta superfamily hydrolase